MCEMIVKMPIRASELQEHRYFSVLCDGCRENIRESRVVRLRDLLRLTLCEECYRRMIGNEDD